MKKYKLLSIVFITGLLLLACKDDDKKSSTTPVISDLIIPTSSEFSDSIIYSVTLTDKTPLSTLKVRLYYGEEVVGELITRAKTSGTYIGKVYAPYYKDIPDGKATLTFTCQNIEFGLAEEKRELPLKRPDYSNLILVSEDGTEYTMVKSESYVYKYNGDMPLKLNGYIKSPMPTDQDKAKGKNQMVWGWVKGEIKEAVTGLIPFQSNVSPYDIFFNTKSYEAGPFPQPVIFDGENMKPVKDNFYSVTKNFTKDQEVVVNGLGDISGWWIDSDYFTYADNKLKFTAPTGLYRVIAIATDKFFSVTRMFNETTPARFDNSKDAMWILGWGTGKPSGNAPYDYGWNFITDDDKINQTVCVNKISANIYRTTIRFKEVKVNDAGTDIDYPNFKFFGASAGAWWDSEIKFNTINGGFLWQEGKGKNILSIPTFPATPGKPYGEAGNFDLSGNTINKDKFYRLTVDISGGLDEATLTVEEL